jgi:ABC-type branched-subunit amino acid transport system permease subunit
MMHLKLALAIAFIGFVFTSRQWLQVLQKLSPETGMIAKQLSILVAIFILTWADPTLRFKRHHQAIGVLLVYMAFNIIFNYQSEWISDVGASNVERQTPDGAVYHRSKTNLNLNPEMARIVTFVFVPFVMVLGGSKLLRNGQNLNIN